MSDYARLIAEAREPHYHNPKGQDLCTGQCVAWQLADAMEQLQTRVAELEGEQVACHELLDEFFEHPKDPGESVASKLSRLIKDSMLVLEERDILIRGVRAATELMRFAPAEYTPEGSEKWQADVREAIAIAEKQEKADEAPKP